MKLAKILFKIIQRLEKNNNADFDTNGEKRLLNDFIKNAPEEITVVDAGANVGEFSEMCISMCNKYNKKINLLIIEPQKSVFKTLQEKFQNASFVRLENVGVSDEEKEINIYIDPNHSKHASIFNRAVFQNKEIREEKIRLKKLDDLLDKYQIAKVDLLKLDVEGNELSALAGARKALENGIISHIQFEYGGANLDSNTTLQNIYKLLEKFNYRIYKIFPSSIQERSYHPLMENYQYSNYVAKK